MSNGGCRNAAAPALPPLVLDPVADAARAARRYVRDALEMFDRADLIDSATLAVSELVTNACLHTRSAFSVWVRRTNGDVRIEVTDASQVSPELRRNRSLATTGRGLQILDALGRWGVTSRSDGLVGKTVWFEPSA